MTTYMGPHTTLPSGSGHGPGRLVGKRRRDALPEIGPPTVNLENVASWLKSEAMTRILGSVSLPVIEARTMACVSGGDGGSPCPMLRQKGSKPDPIGFCGGCGCGDREEGRLSRKVTMRGVRRPNGCLWPAGD